MQIGDKIKKIRDLKGLKQEEVADKLNITQQAYGKIERNESKLDTERLHQIAEIFGLTAEDIENFDDKNIFINHGTKCGQGTCFTINNHSDIDKVFPLLEKMITQQSEMIAQQQEEIQFLRTQISKILENKV